MQNLIAAVNDILADQKVSLADRPAAVALLVAEAVGNSLPLPTSPVDDPFAYFRNTHQVNLNHTLDEVNKGCVIDIDEVEAVVFKLWLTRYRLVHQPENPRAQKLLKMLMDSGAEDIPARYTSLSQQYPALYANRCVMASMAEAEHVGI